MVESTKPEWASVPTGELRLVRGSARFSIGPGQEVEIGHHRLQAEWRDWGGRRRHWQDVPIVEDKAAPQQEALRAAEEALLKEEARPAEQASEDPEERFPPDPAFGPDAYEPPAKPILVHLVWSGPGDPDWERLGTTIDRIMGGLTEDRAKAQPVENPPGVEERLPLDKAAEAAPLLNQTAQIALNERLRESRSWARREAKGIESLEGELEKARKNLATALGQVHDLESALGPAAAPDDGKDWP